MSQNPKSQARSAARLGAVQALYQQQMEGTALAKLLNEFHQYRLGRVIEDEEYAEADVDFFDDIVAGVDARRAEIDDKLTGRLADGWTLARLDKTMLQILRAGAYELLARPDGGGGGGMATPAKPPRSANMSMLPRPSSTTAKPSS